MPVAIMVLFAMLTLTAAAAGVTVHLTHETGRDQQSKRALAAADAGLEAAIQRLSVASPAAGACVQISAGVPAVGGTPDAGGWCPSMSNTLGDGASYKVRISQGQTQAATCSQIQARKVVATGFSGDARQRVIANATKPAGGLVYQCAVIGRDQYNLGETARVYGDVATNGKAVFEQSAYQCGSVKYGTTWHKDAGSTLTCPNNNQTRVPNSVPPLTSIPPKCNSTNGIDGEEWSVPKASATVGCDEAQGRICNPAAAAAADNTACDDTITDPDYNNCGQGADQTCWDPTERELTLDNGAKLELTGNIYSFCRIRVIGGDGPAGNRGGARLSINPRNGGSAIIEIDSPEKCNTDPNSPPQVDVCDVQQGGGIENKNEDPSTLQLLVRGSTSTTATAAGDVCFETHFGGTNEWYSNMVINAPNSNIKLRGDTRILGAVWGKTVRIAGGGTSSGARVAWSDDVSNLAGYGVGAAGYSLDNWSQCSPPVINPTDTELTNDCST